MTKNSVAFPNRMNMMVELQSKRDVEERHARDAEYDREVFRMRRDLGLADSPEEQDEMHPKSAPHHHVEKYIALPIGERQRQELERALEEHAVQDEEAFYAALLDLGLRTLRQNPNALDLQKVKEDLRSPLSAKASARQKFRREWEALCDGVRRGWR